jgi:hypothetical protein
MSPNAGGGRELRVLSQSVQLYTGAQIYFGDLAPYLNYDKNHITAKSIGAFYLLRFPLNTAVEYLSYPQVRHCHPNLSEADTGRNNYLSPSTLSLFKNY